MGPFRDGWTHENVLAVLAKDDPLEVLYAPIVVGMNAPDCGAAWAQGICQRLAEHPNTQVRANAILGLSHIARTCRALDLDLALPAVQRALSDEQVSVQETARDVIEDLKIFMRQSFKNHSLASALMASARSSRAGDDA